MEIKAKGKYLKTSPRKARLVVEAVKSLEIDDCKVALVNMPKKAAGLVWQVVKSALYNAKNNFNLDESDLYIKDIQVREGPRLKRIDKSHGARFDRGIIQKRMCHIEVILGTKEEKVVKKKKKKPQVRKGKVEVKKDIEEVKKEARRGEKKGRKESMKSKLEQIEEKKGKKDYQRKSFGRV